ncbi:MAG: alpha/beta hydrolase [Planctomycetaceae bacterium]
MQLVLLPGLDGTGLLFEPLCRELSPDITPVVISYPTQQTATYSELIELVRPKLPTGESYIILAESFSGPVAIKLAAERPAGLRGLILCASFVTCPHRFVPRWAARLVVPAMFYPAPMLAKFRALVGKYSSPELRSLIDKSLSSVAPAVLAERLREVIRINATDELQRCMVPILYLQGTRDYVVPVSNLTRIRQIQPETESIRIDAPHMILQTQPVIAAQAIERFVRQVGETGWG